MAWTGHSADFCIAYRAARSAVLADVDLAMGTSDITTVANAEATALVNAANPAINHVSQRQWGVNCARGFRMASNMGGTFGSTFSVLEASLPTNTAGAKCQAINGA